MDGCSATAAVYVLFFIVSSAVFMKGLLFRYFCHLFLAVSSFRLQSTCNRFRLCFAVACFSIYVMSLESIYTYICFQTFYSLDVATLFQSKHCPSPVFPRLFVTFSDSLGISFISNSYGNMVVFL